MLGIDSVVNDVLFVVFNPIKITSAFGIAAELASAFGCRIWKPHRQNQLLIRVD
jgi:hypothetical protein